MLLVSHSMEDIARIADRVLVINNSHAAMFDDDARGVRPRRGAGGAWACACRRSRRSCPCCANRAVRLSTAPDDGAGRAGAAARCSRKGAYAHDQRYHIRPVFPRQIPASPHGPAREDCPDSSLFIVFIFVAQNFVALALPVLAALAAMFLSGVPLRQYLKSLKADSLYRALYLGAQPLLRRRRDAAEAGLHGD